MKLRIEKPVTVITPSIGKIQLRQACQSVANQTYKNIKHLIVIDGPEYWHQGLYDKICVDMEKSNLQITVTPENTGKGKFYGHRIYAAYPHLVESDYIAFLDEDNWWNENHIQSLVDKVEDNNLDWAYSLRDVYIGDEFLDHDCCESTGKYPIWFSLDNEKVGLVDTSSYFFRRDFLINVSHLWHSGWGGDRRFFKILTQEFKHTNFDTTGLHTLNYRLPDMKKAYGGDLDFFKRGNDFVKQYYGGEYPWKQKI
jgi:glycosyltransferase involved in cell wall biosynthesis